MGARWDAIKGGFGAIGNYTKLGMGHLGSATKTVLVGGGKLALAGAAVAGGIYAASSLVGAMRSGREYKEEPKPDPLMAPDPYAEMGLLPAMDAPQTMMGMQPVEGRFAQQVLARRGGMAQGVDPSSPELEQDGRSTIDGRPVQNLGGIGM